MSDPPEKEEIGHGGDSIDAISTSTKVNSSTDKQNTTKDNPPPPPPPPQNTGKIQDGPESSPSLEKPFILLRAWKKLGINPLVFMIMVKPAISATIAMAIYQKYSVATNYLNLGYIIIIISIITVPILPRGKYLMNLFLCVVSPKCFATILLSNLNHLSFLRRENIELTYSQ